MSDENQPKKNKPSEDDQSEHSDEEPRPELSPGDAEDKCLLPALPAEGAEALPVASGSGAQSLSVTEGLTGLFKKISPFKKKESSKARKPPCKKLKKDGSFVKVKNAFRKTFRRSAPNMAGNVPAVEGMRLRKYSDPTHSKTKSEPETEDEHATVSELKSKKSLFGSSKGASTSKGAREKTKEPKAKKEPKADKETKAKKEQKAEKETKAKKEQKAEKETKAKKEPKAEKEQKEKEKSKSKKDFSEESSASTSKAATRSEVQKHQALSAQSSYSVGFFGEHLLSSESSAGVDTKSTSVALSPDEISGSRRTSMKRRMSSIQTDEEFCSD